MLAPARSPLGAPGVFALPSLREPVLHPERMDVCAFVGVAPRGPAQQPRTDERHPAGWQRLVNDPVVQRSVPVAVRSFDEYLRHFGGFEGPGLLPHAVASYFEQGGRLAWVLRIVPRRDGQPFHTGCAQAALQGAFGTEPLLLARNPGRWGDTLQVRLDFQTRALTVQPGPGATLLVDPLAPVLPGALLRLHDGLGGSVLATCTGLLTRRDPLRPRQRRELQLDPPPAGPVARVEQVEVTIEIDDGAGRRERFERLALSPQHPRWLASVLCEESALLWPHPDWAASALQPLHARLELLQGQTHGFSGGDDGYGALQHGDFFDPAWSAADDEPGSGITALTGLAQLTQLLVPDLYLPTAWSPPEALPATEPAGAGATFAPCVVVPAQAAVEATPASALTGLLQDPRTAAGLDAVSALQQQVLDVCEATGNLIALLDVPPGLSQARIEDWRSRFDSAYAAAYHPWLVPSRRPEDPWQDSGRPPRRLPPSAVAAGVIARRELERGIQHGPANEIARQVVGLAEPQPEGRADALHPQHVNCFVREPRGIALVAARTLSHDPAWRQLSVRRLMLMLRRTLLAQTQWAVFEPNGPALWRDLRHACESLLRRLYQAGAFAGRSEAASFFVRLVNDRARQDRGELQVEIGVAPAEPLEFILVRLRRDGDGTLNLEEV